MAGRAACTRARLDPVLTEERKVVTVLFCDLVDFTAASDSADPEDVRARLRPYHARLRKEIERFGGTVEKFIGDAVMAVYGAPIAHEDDAERAVRSALRILEAIDEMNEADQGLGLQVRIGVATGEAVVTLGARPEAGEGIVAGDVVNTAARIQGVAPVGGIAVGEQTFRTTEGLFDYEGLEPVQLKGKAQPVPLWRARAARSRFGADLARSHATPMVGRELEQRLLQDAFQRTIRERSTQLVTVVGEPGVGKSRIVSELFAYVDTVPEIVRWRQGRCLPYGEGITFWALGEIVKAEAGILESDAPEAVVAKLDAIVPEGPDREWLRQRLLPLLGLEATSTAEREELFTAWRRFLEAMADQGPSVFVFEDLHWADDAMLAFLEHLADWSEGVPMLIVGTARPELFERHPTWASSARNATRLNLAPLSEDETAQLISLLLEQAVLPAEVQALILDRAGGNPLYAEEFVRLLRDRGLLVGTERVVGLAEGAEIPFPESVQALIAARLDTLTPERKTMLHDAAVIGKVFWAGAIAAMGGLDARAVREALHELSRKELVRPMRVSSIAAEDEYAFWHILVRDVAYGQIPRAARGERHRRAAAWIESAAGERVEDEAEILAYHYTTALDLARAAGQPVAPELEDAALRFLVLAGERAIGLDIPRADAHLARALELARPEHPRRPQILARWADATRQAGRHAEAASALAEAVALFRERGEILGAARAMTTLANVQWQLGDKAGRATAAGAVALLETVPPGPELAEALAEVAAQEHLGGEYRESIVSATRAIELAKDLGLGEQAKPLGYLGASQLTVGDPTGLDVMLRAATLAEQSGQGREAAILMNNVADATSQVEGPAIALGLYRKGMEFAERRGMSESTQWMTAEAAGQMVRLGELDEALSALRRPTEAFEASGRVNGLVRCLAVRAVALTYRGRAPEALPGIDRAVEAAPAATAVEGLIFALQIGALVHFATGDADGARTLLGRLVDDRRATASSTYSFFLPDAVRTAVAAGDVPLAERLIESMVQAVADQRHARAAARAIVAEARGETAAAADLYAQAAQGWEEFGVVTERAFALLGQGRCLVALGRPDEATDPLRTARDLFAAMGAQPSVAETDALLQRTAALAS
jgi:class 3 adenylate cyclase/tetratricopeptide (TPR) repeat protein